MSKMKYAVLFRTHYWSSYLAERLEEVKASASGGDVFVAYDATSSLPPDIPEVAPHSLASLEEMGLYIPQSKALWFCGDYPFYDFFLNHPSYDFYLMIENDVYLNKIDLDDVVARAHASETEVLGVICEYDPQKANDVAKLGRDLYGTWQKCFFPVVGLTKSALLSMFAQRMLQSQSKRKNPEFEFPFCETFVGSEAVKLGLKYSELKSFMPLRTFGASQYMLHDRIRQDARPGVWHSVFPADRYLAAVVNKEFKRWRAQSFTTSAIVDDLRCLVNDGGLTTQDVEGMLLELSASKENAKIFAERITNFIVPSLSSTYAEMK